MFHKKTIVFEAEIKVQMRQIRVFSGYWQKVDEKYDKLAEHVEKLWQLTQTQIEMCQSRQVHNPVNETLSEDIPIPPSTNFDPSDIPSYSIENAPLFQNLDEMPNLVLVRYHTIVFANTIIRECGNYCSTKGLKNFDYCQIAEILRSLIIAVAAYRDAVILLAESNDIEDVLELTHKQNFKILMNTEAPRWQQENCSDKALQHAKGHEISTGDHPTDNAVVGDSAEFISKPLRPINFTRKPNCGLFKLFYSQHSKIRLAFHRHMYMLEKVYKCKFRNALFSYQPYPTHSGYEFNGQLETFSTYYERVTSPRLRFREITIMSYGHELLDCLLKAKMAKYLDLPPTNIPEIEQYKNYQDFDQLDNYDLD